MKSCRYSAGVLRGDVDEYGRTITTVCFCVLEKDHAESHLLSIEQLTIRGKCSA